MDQKRQTESRRTFIGAIMGEDEGALLRLWREKRGEAEPEDLSGNLIVQLGTVTEELNRRWYQANTGQALRMCRSMFGIRASAGWARHSTAAYRHAEQSSKPNSCCRGRSRKKPRPRNICRSCSTTCGSSLPGRRCSRSLPAAAMGRNQDPCRSALPAPDRHGRAEVLALCREWRAPCPFRCRSSEAAH